MSLQKLKSVEYELLYQLFVHLNFQARIEDNFKGWVVIL